jgi:hypothetical protein
MVRVLWSRFFGRKRYRGVCRCLWSRAGRGSRSHESSQGAVTTLISNTLDICRHVTPIVALVEALVDDHMAVVVRSSGQSIGWGPCHSQYRKGGGELCAYLGRLERRPAIYACCEWRLEKRQSYARLRATMFVARTGNALYLAPGDKGCVKVPYVGFVQ